MVYLNRKVIQELSFKAEGTFEGMYAAERRLYENGYRTGSLSIPHKKN